MPSIQNFWNKLNFIDAADVLDNLQTANSFSTRVRVTTAALNTGGAIVIPAPVARVGLILAPLRKALRLVSCMMISIGGAAAGATSVNLQGTRAASTVQLVIAPVASIAQSVPFAPSAAAHVAADGASFTTLDPYTAIVASTVGSALTGSTNVDFIVDFAVDLVA